MRWNIMMAIKILMENKQGQIGMINRAVLIATVTGWALTTMSTGTL
jgi:hypothetical protein